MIFSNAHITFFHAKQYGVFDAIANKIAIIFDFDCILFKFRIKYIYTK